MREMYEKNSRWVRGQKDECVYLKICQLHTVGKGSLVWKKIVQAVVSKCLIILSSHWTTELNNSRHFHSYCIQFMSLDCWYHIWFRKICTSPYHYHLQFELSYSYTSLGMFSVKIKFLTKGELVRFWLYTQVFTFSSLLPLFLIISLYRTTTGIQKQLEIHRAECCTNS